MGNTVVVRPVRVRDPEVLQLIDALTVELAASGYRDDESFGYSPEQLEHGGVYLVGARIADRLAGIGGVELQDDHVAELKRFYVHPEDRGSGVADALMAFLVALAQEHAVRVLRLETGDRQHAALKFYRRHGFVKVPRFPPYVESARSICLQRDL